jgi:uncharacterized YccA/Bax inhibitor family protein
LLVTAGIGWTVCHPTVGTGTPALKIGLIIGGLIGSLICGLALFFSQRLAPVLAPAYALCEGLLIGAISGMYAAKWHGIVPQAALLTIGIMVVMLLAYTSRVIRATPALTKGIMIATAGVFFVYLVTFLLQLLGVREVAYLHQAGPVGIIFSLIVVGIAAFNFILDFNQIEMGARFEAPKYMEWYAAYGLLVTLVWLYLEVLRLLAKLRSSD